MFDRNTAFESHIAEGKDLKKIIELVSRLCFVTLQQQHALKDIYRNNDKKEYLSALKGQVTFLKTCSVHGTELYLFLIKHADASMLWI